MKRRRLLITVCILIALVIALVAGLYAFAAYQRRKLVAKAQTALSQAIGMPCTFEGIDAHHRVVRGLRVGPSEAPYLEVARLRYDDLFLKSIDSIRIDADDSYNSIQAHVPGWPKLIFDQHKFRVEGLAALRRRETDSAPDIFFEGDCRAFNPLLEKRGDVRFEQGKLFVWIYGTIRKDKLDLWAEVRFENIKVRSLDRTFGIEAKKAVTTVRVTGTLPDLKLDVKLGLGKLEPYLGKKFVESFKEHKP